MNPVNTTKRIILRALLAAGGAPMSEEVLLDASRSHQPALLLSDFHQAARELETDKFIIGSKDDLDDSAFWALTTKGVLRAKQL